VSMFEYSRYEQDQPDRAFVLVDGKFDIAIIRTPEGIVIDVYPKLRNDLIATFTVWDDDVPAEVFFRQACMNHPG
jgi:hypothetical protein